MIFNKSEQEKFELLFTVIRNKNLDYKNIKNIKALPEFLDCIDLLNKKISSKFKVDRDDLHGIIIEYRKKSTSFDEKKFQEILTRFITYFQTEQDYTHYFCPIYNFETRIAEMEIDQYCKIRKIKKWEYNRLKEIYQQWRPVKAQLGSIENILIISINKNDYRKTEYAKDKKEELLHKFRICSKGSIKFGGLYEYAKSGNWNPTEELDKLEFDKPGLHSIEKYKVEKAGKKKFLSLMKKIGNRYPSGSDPKYLDYFDKIIRRFSSTLDKIHPSDKITDFVICMEALLVKGNNESSFRFKQNCSLLLGDDDDSRKKLMNVMGEFYSFRSKQVHELNEKAIDIPGRQKMTTLQALPEIEDLARKSILKMIILSQEDGFKEFNYSQLITKIEESVFDTSLKERFVLIEKEF